MSAGTSNSAIVKWPRSKLFGAIVGIWLLVLSTATIAVLIYKIDKAPSEANCTACARGDNSTISAVYWLISGSFILGVSIPAAVLLLRGTRGVKEKPLAWLALVTWTGISVFTFLSMLATFSQPPFIDNPSLPGDLTLVFWGLFWMSTAMMWVFLRKYYSSS